MRAVDRVVNKCPSGMCVTQCSGTFLPGPTGRGARSEGSGWAPEPGGPVLYIQVSHSPSG